MWQLYCTWSSLLIQVRQVAVAETSIRLRSNAFKQASNWLKTELLIVLNNITLHCVCIHFTPLPSHIYVYGRYKNIYQITFACIQTSFELTEELITIHIILFPYIQTSLKLTEELIRMHYITFACIQTRHEKTEYTIVFYNIAFACNQTSFELTEELITINNLCSHAFKQA